jgi:DNA sulfur modification protein DndC
LIKKEYENAVNDWYLGYSGGKDSTAMLILIINALKSVPPNDKCKIHVVYCDTGVEFPIVVAIVKSQFEKLSTELHESCQCNFEFHVVSPSMDDRYFTMVIGKGYVPPTYMFRWCTRRLRIKPIQILLNDNNQKATVLLGVRKGESATRNRVINNCATGEYYSKQTEYPNTLVFCPIINYSTDDIWNIITKSIYPQYISRQEICNLYASLGTQFTDKGVYVCDKQQGRFGCWTCTVVRRDRAMQGLINNGYSTLVPLQEFMTWLRKIRDISDLREPNRMTGKAGKGPFKLSARKNILEQLLVAQEKSGLNLISCDEIAFIKALWQDA